MRRFYRPFDFFREVRVPQLIFQGVPAAEIPIRLSHEWSETSEADRTPYIDFTVAANQQNSPSRIVYEPGIALERFYEPPIFISGEPSLRSTGSRLTQSASVGKPTSFNSPHSPERFTISKPVLPQQKECQLPLESQQPRESDSDSDEEIPIRHRPRTPRSSDPKIAFREAMFGPIATVLSGYAKKSDIERIIDRLWKVAEIPPADPPTGYLLIPIDQNPA
jgi:hypothetical protein